MPPLEVVFRPEAINDLTTIFNYVLDQSQSLKIAQGFVRRIRDRCETIGILPQSGRPREDLAPGLRTIGFEKSVVIAYVVAGERVRITNIFYGGRDFEALYRNTPREGEP